MIELLFIAIMGFSIVDFLFTKRRIGKFGIKIELSTITKFFVSKLGLGYGAFLGTVPMSALFAGSFISLGWTHALSFYAGWKAMLFVIQIDSLGIEHKFE